MRKIALLSTVAIVAFMSEVVETVMVKGADGSPLRVNKSDFDADQDSDKPTMKLHADDKDETAPVDQVGSIPALAEGVIQGTAPSSIDPNAPPPIVPSPGQMAVKKQGKKFVAVYVDGSAVVDSRIDPKGYDDEAAVWAALVPVMANPTPLGTPPIGDGSTPLQTPAIPAA